MSGEEPQRLVPSSTQCGGDRGQRRHPDAAGTVPGRHPHRGVPARASGQSPRDATGQPAHCRRCQSGQDHRSRVDHPGAGAAPPCPTGGGGLPGVADRQVALGDARPIRPGVRSPRHRSARAAAPRAGSTTWWRGCSEKRRFSCPAALARILAVHAGSVRCSGDGSMGWSGVDNRGAARVAGRRVVLGCSSARSTWPRTRPRATCSLEPVTCAPGRQRSCRAPRRPCWLGEAPCRG